MRSITTCKDVFEAVKNIIIYNEGEGDWITIIDEIVIEQKKVEGALCSECGDSLYEIFERTIKSLHSYRRNGVKVITIIARIRSYTSSKIPSRLLQKIEQSVPTNKSKILLN